MESCYKGEWRNGIVAGGKVGVKGKKLVEKIIACLYIDRNVFWGVEQRGGDWQCKRERGESLVQCPWVNEGWEGTHAQMEELALDRGISSSVLVRQSIWDWI